MWYAAAGIVAILLPLCVGCFVVNLLKSREEIDGLPQPPMPSKLFGHLYIALELRKLFPQGCHGQVWAEYIRIKYNQPDVFYVDWRPLGPLILYIADPEVAAQPSVTTLTSTKNATVERIMTKILGNRNIITAHGAEWRALRSLFSPAFQPQHITSLTDSVVESCLTLCQILREKAAGEELFKLNDVTLRTTIEMICSIIFGAHIACQRSMHPMTQLFLERIHMMPNAFFLWEDVRPLRELRLRTNKKKLDAAINGEIDLYLAQRRVDHMENPGGPESGRMETRRPFGTDRSRSIIHLSLKTYEKERGMCITEPSDMPEELRGDVVDCVKAIIFAGYDATAATLCWAFYLLHRHPDAQRRLEEELDAVLPGPSEAAADAIKADHRLVGRLEYATAVVRETLRLFPPASGLRAGGRSAEAEAEAAALASPGTGTGRRFPVWPHCAVWPCAHMIHRNARFFPRPLHFVPERWIRELTPFPEHDLLFTTKAGRDAFRAFGKGPRACIGSELAMLQMRIVLALAAREFEFVPEYPGEAADLQYPTPASIVDELSEDGSYGRGVRAGTITPDRIEGHRMYMQLLMIGKPVGGAPGRIRRRRKNQGGDV